MTQRISICGDSEYSQIRFFKSDSPALNQFSIGAELYQKKTDVTSETVKQIWLNNTEVSKPVSGETYRNFFQIVGGPRKDFNIAITKKNGETLVTVSCNESDLI